MSLPTDSPVSKDVFSQLHVMDDTFMTLDLNSSHPAIEPSIVADAITFFKNGRDTFLSDDRARKKAHKKLQSATKEVESLFRLYEHLLRIKRLLSKDKPPELGHPVTVTTAGARWEYGYNLAPNEARAGEPKVKVRPINLDHGLHATECLLTLKKEWFKHSAHRLSFMDRSSRPINVSMPPNEYSSGAEVTIVGFSLSCDNAEGESVTFKIIFGGILSSSLWIDVDAPHGRNWHCRVFYVDHELGHLAKTVGSGNSWCASPCALGARKQWRRLLFLIWPAYDILLKLYDWYLHSTASSHLLVSLPPQFPYDTCQPLPSCTYTTLSTCNINNCMCHSGNGQS